MENPLWGAPRIHGELQRTGVISSRVILGGIHHHYVRTEVFGTHKGQELIDQSQKMMAAAMQMADIKVCAHRS